jgi:hypothetical protein
MATKSAIESRKQLAMQRLVASAHAIEEKTGIGLSLPTVTRRMDGQFAYGLILEGLAEWSERLAQTYEVQEDKPEPLAKEEDEEPEEAKSKKAAKAKR